MSVFVTETPDLPAEVTRGMTADPDVVVLRSQPGFEISQFHDGRFRKCDLAGDILLLGNPSQKVPAKYEKNDKKWTGNQVFE